MDLSAPVPLGFVPIAVRYNHGLALLSSLLKARGVQTALYELTSVDEFAWKLAFSASPVACFSATTQQDYHRTVPFMRAAAQAGKQVLLGGTWASLGRPVDPCTSEVCRGDGETLPDYLLSGDDRLFREPMVCEDLNALPLPDYDLFEGIPFDRGIPECAGKKCLPYVSSRGCPYPCPFCQIRLQAPGYRVRTKVEDDLRTIIDRYQPDLIFIGDAQLPYASKAWRDSWGEFRCPFVAYIRADIAPDLLAWLIDRGMVGCAFGVESGDERYRDEVLKKGLSDDEVWRTVNALKTAGVWYMAFFMTHTPGESFAHRTQTATMARAIGPYAIVWQYEELGTWH